MFCVLGDFLLSKNMDQRICIKFCVKNKIKCSETLEMLTVAYGETVLSKKMFTSGTNSSKMAGKMPMTSLALDAQARQQLMKTFKQ